MDTADYVAFIMFGLGIAGVVIITVLEILHRKKVREAAIADRQRIPK